MAEVLSDFIYVKNSCVIPTSSAEVPALDPSPIPSSGNTNDLPNTPTNTQPAPTNSASSANYITDFQEIFKPFQEVQKIFKFNKVIQCFKNNAKLTKNCSNSMDEMFIIIYEFDNLASEFNTDNE